MREQEQTITYKKIWLTPSLIILTRQGEQENILVACKMDSSPTGSNIDLGDCADYTGNNPIYCSSLSAS